MLFQGDLKLGVIYFFIVDEQFTSGCVTNATVLSVTAKTILANATIRLRPMTSMSEVLNPSVNAFGEAWVPVL